MLDQAAKDLTRYRLEKAGGILAAAKRDFEEEDYSSANNCAYYCIFHAMYSLLALELEDYKKHSAVIARFFVLYLKTGLLPRKYGVLISNASLIRNRSDYEDFYICSVDDTKRLLEGAEGFLKDVSEYLEHVS